MIGQIARIIAAVALAGLAGGSFLVTGHLVSLEKGIEQDVATVRQMVAVQQTIRHQNEILTDMVAVTERIGTGLDSLITATEAIRAQAAAVSDANRATLALNAALEGNNAATAAELQKVVASLQQMNQSAAVIDQSLAGLRGVVAGDAQALRAVADNTARMNLKTPGW